MNNIGVGIFCFGDDYYYNRALDKVGYLLSKGYKCYVLTDQPEYFENQNIKLIEYNKDNKSYHDKVILIDKILKDCDICILMDADIYIKDYSFFSKFKKYKFKRGISFPFTLKNHKTNREFVGDLPIGSKDWIDYTIYVSRIYPEFRKLKTIWENFLVINKDGFDNSFFEYYKKLQTVKDNLDIKNRKRIIGNGEGVSIMISAKLANIEIEQDIGISNIIKNNISDVSRKFTPKNKWEDFMKDE